MNELVKAPIQEADILKPNSVLFNSDVPVEQCVEDKKECRVTLAELLGDMMWEELSDCLIQNCLVNSIPTNSSKLEQYIEVGLKIFQIYVVEIPHDHLPLKAASKRLLLCDHGLQLSQLFPKDCWELLGSDPSSQVLSFTFS